MLLFVSLQHVTVLKMYNPGLEDLINQRLSLYPVENIRMYNRTIEENMCLMHDIVILFVILLVHLITEV